MAFTFDGDVDRKSRRCDVCGEEHEIDTGFVLKDGDQHAVYWAYWYPHENEAWVDAVLGSWEEPDYSDNVTFGCRIGHIDGQDAPWCSLVRAGQLLSENVMWGRKLDRDDALAHPSLPAFWELVDWLMLNDELLHEHVFHMPSPSE